HAYRLLGQAELTHALTPDRVRLLCDDHYGVGSDGLLEIMSTDGAQAEIRIWNPDGSTAELSGNGVRIVAAWLARRSGAEHVTLRVAGRELRANVRGAQIVLDVGRVEVSPPEQIDLGDERVQLIPVSVGNPHAVIRREP